MKQFVKILVFILCAAASGNAVCRDKMPEGSYKNSCTSCSYDESSQTLDCVCRYGKKNEKKRTTKKSECGKYKNMDGYLTCE